MSVPIPPASPWCCLRRSTAPPESCSVDIVGVLCRSAVAFLLGFPLLLADGAAAQSVITISAITGRVTEGGRAIFRIEASPALAEPLTVMLEVTDSGSFAASERTGTIEVLAANSTTVVAVATINDNTAEEHGTIAAAVRPGSYTIGTQPDAVVQVSDDDITTRLALIGTTPLPEGGRRLPI